MDVDQEQKDTQGGWELVKTQEEKKKLDTHKLVRFLNIIVNEAKDNITNNYVLITIICMLVSSTFCFIY